MHFPPKFVQKRFPPTFSMVHLLHRLYGVDAPEHLICATFSCPLGGGGGSGANATCCALQLPDTTLRLTTLVVEPRVRLTLAARHQPSRNKLVQYRRCFGVIQLR